MIKDSPMKLIALAGKKGVGKSFVGDIIELYAKNTDKTFVHAAFADPIKRFAVENLNISEHLVYGNDDDKETKTQYNWENIEPSLNKNNKQGFMTVREVLQLFGTDICRNMFTKDIWLNRLQRKIHNSTSNIFVVTDLRFGNEVEMIRKEGGKIWQIYGPQRGKNRIVDTHSSENSFDFEPDIIFLNNFDDNVESLMKKVVNLLGN